MTKFFKILIISHVVILIAMTGIYIALKHKSQTTFTSVPHIQKIFPSPTPKPVLQAPPSSKILENNYHIFQTFNNCGPAALSMAFSYYGITKSQLELGNELRPFQVPNGDNDDKSVTLEEMAEKSKEYGFIPYHRPNGDIELIKHFITYDIPIIARTWTKVEEDIGHYRIIKGYDETSKQIIQDDSLQGKNLRYSYDEFNALWRKFNFEYLVLVPKDKIETAKAILEDDVDEETAWKKAVLSSESELKKNPNDIYSRFNLSVALYNIEEFQKSVEEFEKVENSLPFRTLWYQIEPILSYYELGNYDRVFEITNRILNNHNRAFSELYILRGKIYQKQVNLEAARLEFQKAVFYNSNFKSAQEVQDLLSN